MSKVRVAAFSISIDGYGAGAHQSLDAPLGEGGESLHRWHVGTRSFHAMLGQPGGSTGADDEIVIGSFANVGAWILGRNMFGPVRGPWPDESWKGWWGDNPPYHVPVFVLTHHARPTLEMSGGTTFEFVTGGIGEALDRAREAAQGRDVRIGGGASTIRQFLRGGLIDEMHLVVSPTMLGAGEPLLAGFDLKALGFTLERHVTTELAMHVFLSRDQARSQK